VAVTVGQSAEKPVKAAVRATLNVAALTTALGYTVTVKGQVAQNNTYPLVRVDAAGEVANSTYGRNGKDCRTYVQIFDNDPSDLRSLDIQNTVIALMNPAGNYAALNAAALAILATAGLRLIHVNYDGTTLGDPQDDGNGVRVTQRTVMFTSTVREV
jgi:hypothetical protein